MLASKGESQTNPEGIDQNLKFEEVFLQSNEVLRVILKKVKKLLMIQ